MRNYVVAGLAGGLMMTGALITTAPPASAGCMTWQALQPEPLCDGPIQPDGSWQRCIPDFNNRELCWLLGPGHVQPGNIIYNPPLPLNHIDP